MPAVKVKTGFTLIELLVVILIIGIFAGLVLMALSGARESGRNTKRKGDLEQIRSALELFRADCHKYPAAIAFGGQLAGDGTSGCPSSNVYSSSLPKDIQDPSRFYRYSGTTTSYELCASLEGVGGTVTCGSSSNCGQTCNYKVVNP